MFVSAMMHYLSSSLKNIKNPQSFHSVFIHSSESLLLPPCTFSSSTIYYLRKGYASEMIKKIHKTLIWDVVWMLHRLHRQLPVLLSILFLYFLYQTSENQLFKLGEVVSINIWKKYSYLLKGKCLKHNFQVHRKIGPNSIPL